MVLIESHGFLEEVLNGNREKFGLVGAAVFAEEGGLTIFHFGDFNCGQLLPFLDVFISQKIKFTILHDVFQLQGMGPISCRPRFTPSL